MDLSDLVKGSGNTLMIWLVEFKSNELTLISTK